MAHCLVRFVFLFGVFIGVLLAFLCVYLQKPNTFKQQFPYERLYEKWFKTTGVKRKQISMDYAIYNPEKYYLESVFLQEKISLFCIIFKEREEYTDVALLTWGKQCNNITVIDVIKKKKVLPSIGNRDKSKWTLLCKRLTIIPNDSMWYLIITDDTIALIENLRYFVAGLNYSTPYYLGHPVKYWGVTYNLAQAGYVLSQGTLKVFQSHFNNSKQCQLVQSVWKEDLYLGKTLASFNITPLDTRDKHGLSIFQPYPIIKMFNRNSSLDNNVFPIECCSPYSITVKISGKHGALAYFYYTSKLFVFHGGNLGNVPYSPPVNEDEVVENVLKFYGSNEKNLTREEYYDFWVKLLGTYGIFTEEDL